jgi:F0F1-type ATP synthase assembly protein I
MASKSDSVVAMLQTPKLRSSVITLVVVGALLGYAIKIAIDAFKKKQTAV